MTFVQTDGTTHASLIFPGGSTTGLLGALTRHLELKRYIGVLRGLHCYT